jgi:hypothetical protein
MLLVLKCGARQARLCSVRRKARVVRGQHVNIKLARDGCQLARRELIFSQAGRASACTNGRTATVVPMAEEEAAAKNELGEEK